MERFASRILAALAVVCLCSAVSVAAAPADVWSHDVNAAWGKAKASGRPLVLFFTTDGCFFCDKMLKETFKNEAVKKELADGFVPVVVHARTNLELVRKLGVAAFPTTVIVSKDAKVIAAMPGYVDGTQMRQSLRVARTEATPRR